MKAGLECTAGWQLSMLISLEPNSTHAAVTSCSPAAPRVFFEMHFIVDPACDEGVHHHDDVVGGLPGMY